MKTELEVIEPKEKVDIPPQTRAVLLRIAIVYSKKYPQLKGRSGLEDALRVVSQFVVESVRISKVFPKTERDIVRIVNDAIASRESQADELLAFLGRVEKDNLLSALGLSKERFKQAMHELSDRCRLARLDRAASFNSHLQLRLRLVPLLAQKVLASALGSEHGAERYIQSLSSCAMVARGVVASAVVLAALGPEEGKIDLLQFDDEAVKKLQRVARDIKSTRGGDFVHNVALDLARALDINPQDFDGAVDMFVDYYSQIAKALGNWAKSQVTTHDESSSKHWIRRQEILGILPLELFAESHFADTIDRLSSLGRGGDHIWRGGVEIQGALVPSASWLAKAVSNLTASGYRRDSDRVARLDKAYYVMRDYMARIKGLVDRLKQLAADKERLKKGQTLGSKIPEASMVLERLRNIKKDYERRIRNQEKDEATLALFERSGGVITEELSQALRYDLADIAREEMGVETERSEKYARLVRYLRKTSWKDLFLARGVSGARYESSVEVSEIVEVLKEARSRVVAAENIFQLPEFHHVGEFISDWIASYNLSPQGVPYLEAEKAEYNRLRALRRALADGSYKPEEIKAQVLRDLNSAISLMPKVVAEMYDSEEARRLYAQREDIYGVPPSWRVERAIQRVRMRALPRELLSVSDKNIAAAREVVRLYRRHPMAYAFRLEEREGNKRYIELKVKGSIKNDEQGIFWANLSESLDNPLVPWDIAGGTTLAALVISVARRLDRLEALKNIDRVSAQTDKEQSDHQKVVQDLVQQKVQMQLELTEGEIAQTEEQLRRIQNELLGRLRSEGLVVEAENRRKYNL